MIMILSSMGTFEKPEKPEKPVAPNGHIAEIL